MPVVEVHERVLAPLRSLWDVINDVESYPRLMEPFRSVQVLERGQGYRVIAWEVDLRGCLLRWIEREEIDSAGWRIDYHQIEGTLRLFEGYWQLEPDTEDRSQVTLVVRFDIGMPLLSQMLDPIAEHAIRDHAQTMLRSLAACAAQAQR